MTRNPDRTTKVQGRGGNCLTPESCRKMLADLREFKPEADCLLIRPPCCNSIGFRVLYVAEILQFFCVECNEICFTVPFPFNPF